MLIDSHPHLNMGAFDSDRHQVIDRALSAGVRLTIAVGTDIRSSMRAVTLAKGYSFIFTSVGVHPHNADNTDQNYLKQLAFEEMLEILPSFNKNGSKGVIHCFSGDFNLAKTFIDMG